VPRSRYNNKLNTNVLGFFYTTKRSLTFYALTKKNATALIFNQLTVKAFLCIAFHRVFLRFTDVYLKKQYISRNIN